jgi:DnaK suppressor protein
MAQVKLPKGYKPKKNEEYMSDRQLEYFRHKLLEWRQSLLDESQQTIDQMRDAARDVSDEAERASREAEITFELRTRDRYRKLLSKIAQALKRIETESYGFCDETGEPIGLERLEARPIATLSVEAQERREQLERQYGDR